MVWFNLSIELADKLSSRHAIFGIELAFWAWPGKLVS